MAGHCRPVETVERIAVGFPEHGIGHDHAEMGGHLRPMAGIAHGIPHAIHLAGARVAILGHVDQPAPAVIDLDIGKLRKDRAQTCAQDFAALGIRSLVGGGREACPSTKDQPVVGRQPPVIADIHRVHAGPVARHGGRDLRIRQRTGRNQEAADCNDAAPEIRKIRRGIGAGRDEDLVGRHSAPCRPQPVGAAARVLSRDDRALVYHRAVTACGLGEPDDIAAHMHHRALLRQHRAVEG